MSRNVQNVTLSLTLPISCQICLGKVRKPTICCNHHVFCAACIELWLQKCSQCPTCRVPITPDNPCREIIGATNESELTESHSVRKNLRKTRVELLLREYEDELETLQKENEDLRNRNMNLESQMKASLKPVAPPTSPNHTAPDSALLEETANKLRAASDLYQRVQEDVDKLKDANTTLRSQNIDLVHENLRLRAEVENRSPHKFGRFTVAALEVKISQYERDMTQLKKALERSDSYIEELECRVSERRSASPLHKSTEQRGDGGGESGSWNMDSTGADPAEGRSHARAPSCDGASCSQRNAPVRFAVPATPSTPSTPSTPPTPSSALSRLNLKSPSARIENNPASHRLPYLRKLTFDDSAHSVTRPSGEHPPADSGRRPTRPAETRPSPEIICGLSEQKSSVNPANQSVWEEPSSSSSSRLQENERNIRGGSLADDARMDAAFLNIVSELDSMMDDVERSHSHASRHPPDFPTAPLSDPSDPDPDTATLGESGKRKYAVHLTTASPNKTSRIK